LANFYAGKSGIEIYTDGAARGNPGPSASGFIVLEEGKLLNEQSVYNGQATNNYAEYNAVILALGWCIENFHEPGCIDIELYSDSELIIRQLAGRYKVKSEDLAPLNEKAVELIHKFKSVKLNNVPRGNLHITEVDRNLNILLDRLGPGKGAR
jgi:ribonuclease HI